MGVNEAKELDFQPIALPANWKKLFGEMLLPTQIFFYGKGGSGKSSGCLKFADVMTGNGHKVLYVAGEQFGTPTFAKTLQRLDINGHDNFTIVDTLQRKNLSDYDFVVLDSKDSLGLSVDGYRELRKKHPNVSFLITSQGTKDGNFTGNETWRNEVDTMVRAEKGTLHTVGEKNRWGGQGKLKIY